MPKQKTTGAFSVVQKPTSANEGGKRPHAFLQVVTPRSLAVPLAEVANVLLPSGSILWPFYDHDLDPGAAITLTPEQLQEVTDRVVVLVRKSLGTLTSGPSLVASPGDSIFSNSVSSYDNDLGHNISNNIKINIFNDQSVNFGWLLHNFVQWPPTMILSICLSRVVTSRSLLG